MEWEKKKVLVVGMARSGVAAAQLLRAYGAVVTVNDSKLEKELGAPLFERTGRGVAKNIYGEQDMRLFEAGVRYFS